MSPVSPQIHTLLTAAATAADAGHIEDASVLLQEALDHDFMADIAMALHALENDAAAELPFDLRPFIGGLVRIPPAREGLYEAPTSDAQASSDLSADDDDFDFFGSELVVDVDELNTSHGNDTAPAPPSASPLDFDDDDSLLTLDDDRPSTSPETVPVPMQTPASSPDVAEEIESLSQLDASGINLSTRTFEDIDGLEDLDALFADGFTGNSPPDGDSNFSFDADDDISDLSDDLPEDSSNGRSDRHAMMDDATSSMSAPGGRARYAASAPAPPPPSHRRSSTPTGDLSVPLETRGTDDDVSDISARTGSAAPRYRAPSEASPLASMSHVTETDDDLEDFDLFGDSPPPSASHDTAPVTAPTARQAAMPTLSGMASRVQEDTNPSGLATVANENQGPAAEFDNPAVSGVNSTISRHRSSLEKSDFVSARQTHDTGSRRSIHGAGTYRAAGMSEDTGIKRRAAFRVTSTTVLKKRPLTRDQRQMLNPRSMFLYDQVDGLTTVEDLIDISGLAMDEAMVIIEQLVHDNMVDVV